MRRWSTTLLMYGDVVKLVATRQALGCFDCRGLSGGKGMGRLASPTGAHCWSIWCATMCLLVRAGRFPFDALVVGGQKLK